MKKGLKLFVWEDTLVNYTAGIMFALAENVEEARRIISEEAEGEYFVEEDLKENPDIYTNKVGFAVGGGA